MIADARLAQLCAASYDMSYTWKRVWDVDGVHFTSASVDGLKVIVFRGSTTDEDWTRDFRGWPVRDPLIGFCHEGFLEGMRHVTLSSIALYVATDPYVLTGHSLGAARALIAAGLLTAVKRPPAQVAAFGTPKPGFAKLASIVNAGGYPVRLYKNRQDPVCDVPWLMGLYKHPAEQIRLDVDPNMGPRPFSDHKIINYVRGLS